MQFLQFLTELIFWKVLAVVLVGILITVLLWNVDRTKEDGKLGFKKRNPEEWLSFGVNIGVALFILAVICVILWNWRSIFLR